MKKQILSLITKHTNLLCYPIFILGYICGLILANWINTPPHNTMTPPTITNNNPPYYHSTTNDHPLIKRTHPLPTQPLYPTLPLITKTHHYI